VGIQVMPAHAVPHGSSSAAACWVKLKRHLLLLKVGGIQAGDMEGAHLQAGRQWGSSWRQGMQHAAQLHAPCGHTWAGSLVQSAAGAHLTPQACLPCGILAQLTAQDWQGVAAMAPEASPHACSAAVCSAGVQSVSSVQECLTKSPTAGNWLMLCVYVLAGCWPECTIDHHCLPCLHHARARWATAAAVHSSRHKRVEQHLLGAAPARHQ
jgi:hypothetical protein